MWDEDEVSARRLMVVNAREWLADREGSAQLVGLRCCFDFARAKTRSEPGRAVGRIRSSGGSSVAGGGWGVESRLVLVDGCGGDNTLSSTHDAWRGRWGASVYRVHLMLVRVAPGEPKGPFLLFIHNWHNKRSSWSGAQSTVAHTQQAPSRAHLESAVASEDPVSSDG